MTTTTGPGRASPLRPFRHRGFATLWTGSFVSNIGTWMETVAVGVYVTQTTGQAAWTGTVAALTYAPTVLLGPIGGALADRFDRRRFLAGVTLFQTLLAGTLALLAARDALSLPSSRSRCLRGIRPRRPGAPRRGTPTGPAPASRS